MIPMPEQQGASDIESLAERLIEGELSPDLLMA